MTISPGPVGSPGVRVPWAATRGHGVITAQRYTSAAAMTVSTERRYQSIDCFTTVASRVVRTRPDGSSCLVVHCRAVPCGDVAVNVPVTGTPIGPEGM